ncbi:UNVERIFIED_CONTAM: ATPase family associated with various cellular activities (AAA) domain-containing protein [Hammondia hammondi]|eukprot:XP_008885751.1 ATPase family associated with various cellular activities (AAA) domain-containing protein [Hammondia hammondi]
MAPGCPGPPSRPSKPPQAAPSSDSASLSSRPSSGPAHDVGSSFPRLLPSEPGARSPASPQTLHRLEAFQRGTSPALVELRETSSPDVKTHLSSRQTFHQNAPSQRASSPRRRDSPSRHSPSSSYCAGGLRASPPLGSAFPCVSSTSRFIAPQHSPPVVLHASSPGHRPAGGGSPPRSELPGESPTAARGPCGVQRGVAGLAGATPAELGRSRLSAPRTDAVRPRTSGSPGSLLDVSRPSSQAKTLGVLPRGEASGSRNILQEQGRRMVQFGAALRASPLLCTSASAGTGREKAGSQNASSLSSLSPSDPSASRLSTCLRAARPMETACGLRGQPEGIETEAEGRNGELHPKSPEGRRAGSGLCSESRDRDTSLQGSSQGESSPVARVENEGSVVAQTLRNASLFGAYSHRSYYYDLGALSRRPSSSPPRPQESPGTVASPARRPSVSSTGTLSLARPTHTSPAAVLAESVRILPPIAGRKPFNTQPFLPPRASRLGLSPQRRHPPRGAVCPKQRQLRPSLRAGGGVGGSVAKAEEGEGSGVPAKRAAPLGPPRCQKAHQKVELPSYLPTLCSIYLEGKSESARAAVATSRLLEEAGDTSQRSALESGHEPLTATTATELSTGAASVVPDLLCRAEAVVSAESQAQTQLLGQSEEALRRVVTGEDAIAFFARYGATTSTKFLYCNRRKSDAEDQYSLLVVPEKEAEPEHFTISSTGIVHICPGRPSEFMTLSDFSHQAFAFSVLRSMLFFRTFLPRKLLSLWRDSVRRLLYRRQRARLARRLFLAKPAFADHLLEILGVLAELRSVPLIQVPGPGALFDLAGFTALQTATRSDVKTGAVRAFEAKQQRVHQTLQKLMARLHEATLLPEEDPLERPSVSRSKSMVQESEEARERARLLRMAFADEALFGDFVKLVDSILAVRLVDAVTAAVLRLRERLQEESACSKWFRVQVEFGDTRVEFAPSLEQFQGALRDVWEGTVGVAAGVPWFAASRLYEDFVALRGRHSVEELLQTCSAFVRARDDVERHLARDFDRARRYADSYFAIYREIYDYGRAWNEAAVCASLRSHDELSNELEMIRDFQGRLEKLNPTHVVGLFSIQAHDLKATLSPPTENALAALKRLLLQRTREHLRDTVARYGRTNAALDARPTKLLPFAEFVKTYKWTRSQIEELDHAQATAEDMFQLLKQYEVRVAVEDSILLERLSKEAALFEKEKLLGAAEHIRKHLDAMLAELKQESAQVEQETQAISRALSEEQFQNVKLMDSALAVLEALHSYDRQICDLDAKAATLQQTQKLLSPDGAFVFRHTEAAKRLVRPKLKLWTSVYELQAATTEWAATPVSELNGEELQSRVKAFATELQFREAELPSDPVVEALRDRVEVWRTRLPTVLDLNNPALKPRHWTQIFRALSLESESPAPLPLAQLEAAGVFSHAERIAEIASRASAEHALEATLERIRGTLEETNFAIKPLVDNPDCFLLDDVGDVAAQLEEHGAALQSMLFSPFVTDLRAQVETWKAKIDLTGEVLREMVCFQRAWVAFEGVFASGEMEQWLPSEAAAFRQMNEFWADTMRRVRTESANVVATTARPGFAEALKQFNFVAGRVQQSLAAYLETKREAFPRFYFLSDEEVLRVLAARSLERLQGLLPKCFDGVQRVVFTAAPGIAPTHACQSTSSLVSFQRTSSASPFFRSQTRRNPVFPGDHTRHAPPQRPTQALSDPVTPDGDSGDTGDTCGNGDSGETRPSVVASGMISADGEFLQFCEFVEPSEVPEVCFSQVEQCMQFALYSRLQEAWRSYPSGLLAPSSSLATGLETRPERDSVEAAERKRASVWGNANLAKNYLSWLREHPSQCLALADALVFTAQVERALDRGRRDEVGEGERLSRGGAEDSERSDEKNRERRSSQASNKGATRRPETLAACKATAEENIARLVAFQRRKGFPLKKAHAEALVVQCVHRRDVVASLEAAKCPSSSAFEWQKHLRYYWSEEVADCFVHQHDMAFQYAYELSESPRRLVITPLTEKCFLTLTAALRLSYGGALSGPAGTGKTETVKDLAKAVGVPCVVFNCSADFDCKLTARLFSGLAQTGAWSCLDEFNRMDVEVLSVVAQQIRSVQTAAHARLEAFEFEGREIRLNKRYAIFASMNPDYAGRSDLPENLKSLFRPVAMVTPDLARIAEVTLFSSGFRTAETLAKKLVKVFEAAATQLSQQPHYDFDMRAMKSVLARAASLKEKSWNSSDEEFLLLTALKAATLPRLVEADETSFLGLLADAFPESSVGSAQSLLLKKAIEAEMRRRNMLVTEGMVAKALQLHETQNARTGVMLVGAPGTGKTSCISVLAAAATEVRQRLYTGQDCAPTRIVRISPKALDLAALFGEANEATNEWTDGLVGLVIRRAAQESGRKWLVFDGAVDASWAENLNSALDDNHVLCLASGERTKIPPTLTFMFETDSAASASPATISRCGVVCFEDKERREVEAVVHSWAQRLERKFPQASNLRRWTLEICREALPFIEKECTEAVPSLDATRVSTVCSLTTACLLDERVFSGEDEQREALLAAMFWTSAVVWGLGGHLAEEGRAKLSRFLLPRLRAKCAEVGALGDNVDLFAVYVHPESLSFAPLSSLLTPRLPPTPRSISGKDNRSETAREGEEGGDAGEDSSEQRVEGARRRGGPSREGFKSVIWGQSLYEIFIPTEQTVVEKMLLDQLFSVNKSCFLCGETGAGKTASVSAYLRELPHDVGSNTLRLTGKTRTTALQALLQRSLVRSGRLSLGPPADRTQVLLLLDDVNMPSPDLSGEQRPLEFLRHLLDTGGFYDPEPLAFKSVRDTIFLLVAAPPHGGRAKLSRRLLRQVATLWHCRWNFESLDVVFGSLLREWMTQALPTFGDVQEKLVNLTLDTFLKIPSLLLPTPQSPHYTWDLRDLAHVLQGCMQGTKETVTDVETLIKLWHHEACRRFEDCLIGASDRLRLQDFLSRQIARHLSLSPTEPLDSTSVFTALSSAGRLQASYRPLDGDGSEIEEACMRALAEYQLTTPLSPHAKPLTHFVFFADARKHLLRLSRILSLPHGNALLLGVDGCGRQSVAHLAAHVAEKPLYSIRASSWYSPADFREDLKRVLRSLAADGKPVVFLLADSQIRDEQFLEDLVSLMVAGEVPDLFDSTEAEQLLHALRRAGPPPAASEAAWAPRSHFAQLVRERFHVVLALSPVGPSLRSRCRQFPGLRSCTTVDYFDVWPREALLCVAKYFCSAQPDLIPPEDVPTLSAVSADFHACAVATQAAFYRETGRRVYTTGSSFVDFLQCYLHLLDTDTAALQERTRHYRRGISRLEATTKLVEQLRVDLLKSQPVLEKSTRDTQQLRAALERDRQRADEVERACAAERLAAAAARREAQDIKDDCEAEINRVLPELGAALKALDALDKKDIQELKSFPNPPALVETVLQAVCLLKGRKPTWEEAKKLLNDTTLLQQLREFDRDHLPPRLLAQLQKFTKLENFTPEEVKHVSKAATSLCMWVCAIERYAVVTREMEPKKERLAVAEAALAAAEETLAAKQAVLREAQEGILQLEKRIFDSKAHAEKLQTQIADTQVRLARAERLICAVATEATRWAEEARLLDQRAETHSGDMLLSAGMLSYAGSLTGACRKSLLDQWIGKCAEALKVSAPFSLLHVLSSPEEEREFVLQGLPADRLSLENAVLATRSARRHRWPLLVDPQGQARKWLRNTYSLWTSFSSSSPPCSLSSSASSCASSGGCGAWGRASRALGLRRESGRQSDAGAKLSGPESCSRDAEQDCTNPVPFSPPASSDRGGKELHASSTSCREQVAQPTARGVREAGGDFFGEPETKTKGFELKLRSDSPSFLDSLANAVNMGARILVELADDFLDPAVGPFLAQPVSSASLTHAGGPRVAWNPDFRLVLVTAHATPSFAPAVFARVTVINFAITPAGLEEQLLIEAVKQEKPELEEQRDALVVAVAEDMRRKHIIEEDILTLLAGATGDILVDDRLVDVLAASRRTSDDLRRRVRVAEETTQTLDRARDLFRGVAARGALLYFVVAALSRLDAVYRQSLDAFLRVFRHVLEEMQGEGNVAQRVELLQRELTLQVYRRTCHGLFERHKFCFAFLLALTIDKLGGVASKEEYDFLVRGCPASDDLHARDRRASWLAEQDLQQLVFLDSLGGSFAGLLHAVLAAPEAWQRFVDSDFDFSSSLPDGFEEKLTPFQALLLTKALRPEEVVHAARKYVARQLGAEFVEPPPRSLSEAFRDSSACTPMLFLLSAGVDPTEEISRLADEFGAGREDVHFVSLGQGQGSRAAALVAAARETGEWVCLQNCHLAPSFMPTLQRLHEDLCAGSVHQNFRLFLTWMPCQTFPTSLLESAIKITSEPPAGIKANLLRIYAEREESEDPELRQLEQRRDFQRLFFGLALFHAVALERRKFGAIGWNNFYDWTPWDCIISQVQLMGSVAEVRSNQTGFSFDALTFSTAAVNYGGRVTDAMDLRTVDALFRSFVSIHTLEQDFLPSQTPLYRLPDATSFKAWRQAIGRLPLQDPPEAFGLHRNASLMLKEREARELLSWISASSQLRSSESSRTRHFSDWSAMKLVGDLLSGLPPLLDRHQAHASTFEARRNSATKAPELSPLSVFFSHEVANFNALLQLVRTSLLEVQQALAGNTLMSAAIEETHDALVEHRVPRGWTAASYASVKPLAAWFADLAQRVEHIREWMTRGAPKSFWLPAYFRPDALLAATIQTHARKHKIPLDSLTLKATVTKARTPDQLDASPPRGIYIHGLFLQGAGWNASSQRLCESELGALFVPMPVILLEPAGNLEDRRNKQELVFYSCPLYKTPERKGVGNYVHSLDLPTDLPPVHWILRGVALLCQNENI